MAKLVRVSDDTYQKMHEIAAHLQLQNKRKTSLNDAIAYLLGVRDKMVSQALSRPAPEAPKPRGHEAMKQFSLHHKKFV
ncbi:MAG: hypothetical protein AB1626_00885 [Candidatus Micrarchaeota archaeon]